jgi:hypothetical protein
MISHRLINQIDQLREAFSAKDDKAPILISAQSDTVRISTRLADCDRLGYLLTALEAEQIDADREGSPKVDPREIDDQISMLVGRITYLTEGLILVEKAADLSRVLIRSAKPEQRADGTYYYELTLEPGKSIGLNRLCYNFETRRRTIVPFTLSKEVFERLVDELEEILCGKDKEFIDELPQRFKESPLVWDAEY